MQNQINSKTNSSTSTTNARTAAANSAGKKPTKLHSIRISTENQKKIEKLLAVANKKKLGRKIKLDQMLNQVLDLVTEDHIKSLQNQSLTNEDRKELLREKYSQKFGPISKDDFIGVMLSAEFSEFLRDHSDLTFNTKINLTMN